MRRQIGFYNILCFLTGGKVIHVDSLPLRTEAVAFRGKGGCNTERALSFLAGGITREVRA